MTSKVPNPSCLFPFESSNNSKPASLAAFKTAWNRGNLSFILDDYETEEGLFIQHFTGWNLKTFEWVSDYFNKKIVNNFSKIKESGNSVYLIYNE